MNPTGHIDGQRFVLVRPERSLDDGYRQFRSLAEPGRSLYLPSGERPYRLLDVDLCGSIERSFVAGGPSWGPLVFDFDAPHKDRDGMLGALYGARKGIEFLGNLGLRAGSDYRLHLSGGYGFHIIVHPQTFDRCESVNEWSVFHRRFAKSVAAEAGIAALVDQAIYTQNRLLRLDGTRHSKTNLFCTEVDPELVIGSFVASDYEKLASSRRLSDPWPDEISISPYLADLAIQSLPHHGIASVFAPLQPYPCLIQLVKRGYIPPHEFNNVKQFFASTLVENTSGFLSEQHQLEIAWSWAAHYTRIDTQEWAERRADEAARAVKSYRRKLQMNGTAFKTGSCKTHKHNAGHVSCIGCPSNKQRSAVPCLTITDLRNHGVKGVGSVVYEALYSLFWDSEEQISHAMISKRTTRFGKVDGVSRPSTTKWMRIFAELGWIEYRFVEGRGFELIHVERFMRTERKYKSEKNYG